MIFQTIADTSAILDVTQVHKLQVEFRYNFCLTQENNWWCVVPVNGPNMTTPLDKKKTKQNNHNSQ